MTVETVLSESDDSMTVETVLSESDDSGNSPVGDVAEMPSMIFKRLIRSYRFLLSSKTTDSTVTTYQDQ